MDEVLAAQEQCLQVCMDDCLLTSPQLMTLVGKINAVCVQFVNNLERILLLGIEEPSSTSEGGLLRRGLSTLSLSSSSSSAKAPSLFSASFDARRRVGVCAFTSHKQSPASALAIF